MEDRYNIVSWLLKTTPDKLNNLDGEEFLDFEATVLVNWRKELEMQARLSGLRSVM